MSNYYTSKRDKKLKITKNFFHLFHDFCQKCNFFDSKEYCSASERECDILKFKKTLLESVDKDKKIYSEIIEMLSSPPFDERKIRAAYKNFLKDKAVQNLKKISVLKKVKKDIQ